MIVFPKYPTAMNMPGLLECAAQLSQASDRGAECDGHAVRFVDPCAMALFGCVADIYRKKGTVLSLSEFSDETLSYLSRMDAFGSFISRNVELGGRHDRHDSLLEVTRIEAGESTDDAARRLVGSLLGGMSDLPEDEEPDEMSGMTRRYALEEPLEYIFTELLDNAFQHGCRYGFEVSAWVCAQYYPKKGIVRFAIVDNGCGLLRSLGEHPDLPEQSDAAAIRLALRERTSCNPALLLRGGDHSANQGVGLTVVSRIIDMAGGRMWIASGGAVLDLPTGGMQAANPWQGCILAGEVCREALMDIRVNRVIQTLENSGMGVNLDFS